MSTFHDPVQLKNALAAAFFPVLFYTVGTALIKISFGLTLLRILRYRWQKWVSIAIMVSVAIISIIWFFVFLFFCSPVSYTWMRGEDPFFLATVRGKDPVALGLKPRGVCKDNALIADMNYAHGATMVVADLTLGIILPISLLRGLNMKRSLKITTCFVLSLGAIASVVTIIRFPYMEKLAHAHNFFKDTNPLLVWSYIEDGLCIIGAACTTLKPLAVKLHLISDPTSGGSGGRKITPGSRDSKTVTGVSSKRKGWDDTDVEMATSGGTAWAGSSNDSKEDITPPPHAVTATTGINRTVEVHQISRNEPEWA